MFQLYKNIRVLDTSRILVGPYATMMMSDLGAEVIKVESFEGDETRNWGPPFIQTPQGKTSAYFLSLNRGKKAISLNLKEPKGQILFHQLAAKSDVVVQNFNIGVPEKLNIDYQTLKRINPKIIYASINGFGSVGPYSHFSGFDQIVQAASGLMSITGDRDGPPTKVGFAVTDILTAQQTCIAIQAALFRRESTGEGCHIKTSLFESTVASLLNVGSNYLNGNFVQERMGNMHPSIVPYGVYRVNTDHIMIGAASNSQFKSLCKTLRLDNLINDPKFLNNSDRVKNRDILKEILENAFDSWEAEELCDILNENKIPCSKIKKINECLDSEQTKALKLVQVQNSSKYGEIKLVRSPLWFDGEIQNNFIEPPLLNENRDEILKKILQLDQPYIDQLIKENVLLK